jgi:hypothetical protein
MNDNMELLKESLRSLIKTARENPTKNYLLPLAGLGHGEGSVEEILPILIKTVEASPNISLVLPAEGVSLGRQGTVRKDYTRENMPQIKDMLSKAGLLAIPSSTTVKAYRTSDTFSSKVDYAQRGSGTYYALDKPFDFYIKYYILTFFHVLMKLSQLKHYLLDPIQ